MRCIAAIAASALRQRARPPRRGSTALRYRPRPLTAACQRSSMRSVTFVARYSGSRTLGSGQFLVPWSDGVVVGRAAGQVVRPSSSSVPVTPRPSPNVVMCCYLAVVGARPAARCSPTRRASCRCHQAAGGARRSQVGRVVVQRDVGERVECLDRRRRYGVGVSAMPSWSPTSSRCRSASDRTWASSNVSVPVTVGRQDR